MPTTVDGERAEIILNPLGVINRLNPAQLQEQHLNFMADHVVKAMKEAETYEIKEKILFEFLEAITPKEESIQYDKKTGTALKDRFGRIKKTVQAAKNSQWEFFYNEYLLMNRAQKQAFIDETEEKGIYIHQAPFFGNTGTDDFLKILKLHPDWCKEYQFVDIENPMVMGDIYFIRLKHEAGNKSSMRSAGNLNVKNLPAKSNLRKEKKVLYANTPIRMGEMEVTNLMITKRGDIVEKFLKTYSTNEEMREETVKQLIMPGKDSNGININPLNMNINIPFEENSINREILEKFLNVLELSLVDNIEKE